MGRSSRRQGDGVECFFRLWIPSRLPRWLLSRFWTFKVRTSSIWRERESERGGFPRASSVLTAHSKKCEVSWLAHLPKLLDDITLRKSRKSFCFLRKFRWKRKSYFGETRIDEIRDSTFSPSAGALSYCFFFQERMHSVSGYKGQPISPLVM